jgi:hypothetical protein
VLGWSIFFFKFQVIPYVQVSLRTSKKPPDKIKIDSQDRFYLDKFLFG